MSGASYDLPGLLRCISSLSTFFVEPGAVADSDAFAHALYILESTQHAPSVCETTFPSLAKVFAVGISLPKAHEYAPVLSALARALRNIVLAIPHAAVEMRRSVVGCVCDFLLNSDKAELMWSCYGLLTALRESLQQLDIKHRSPVPHSDSDARVFAVSEQHLHLTLDSGLLYHICQFRLGCISELPADRQAEAALVQCEVLLHTVNADRLLKQPLSHAAALALSSLVAANLTPPSRWTQCWATLAAASATDSAHDIEGVEDAQIRAPSTRALTHLLAQGMKQRPRQTPHLHLHCLFLLHSFTTQQSAFDDCETGLQILRLSLGLLEHALAYRYADAILLLLCAWTKCTTHVVDFCGHCCRVSFPDTTPHVVQYLRHLLTRAADVLQRTHDAFQYCSARVHLRTHSNVPALETWEKTAVTAFTAHTHYRSELVSARLRLLQHMQTLDMSQ